MLRNMRNLKRVPNNKDDYVNPSSLELVEEGEEEVGSGDEVSQAVGMADDGGRTQWEKFSKLYRDAGRSSVDPVAMSETAEVRKGEGGGRGRWGVE